MKKALIKEIFSSTQGEGLYVGQKQTFVRFCGCNLSCSYCDTDHSQGGAWEYTTQELFERVKDAKAISLTGGEPLLWADFISEFLNKYRDGLGEIHLETNGTLPSELSKIIQLVDVVAMDIKLKSASGEDTGNAEEFLKCAGDKAFIKIVFDKNITQEEIESVAALGLKYGAPVVLQPKMPINVDFEDVFERFYALNPNVRLIPQTHKFLNVK